MQPLRAVHHREEIDRAGRRAVRRPVDDLREAEKLRELLVEELEPHARREPCEHRLGHVLDDATGERKRERELDEPDVDGRGCDAGDTEVLRQREHHDAQRGRGAGDLKLRATKDARDDSSDRARHEPGRRRHPARDREPDVEREGDGGDGQPREQIAREGACARDVAPVVDEAPGNRGERRAMASGRRRDSGFLHAWRYTREPPEYLYNM